MQLQLLVHDVACQFQGFAGSLCRRVAGLALPENSMPVARPRFRQIILYFLGLFKRPDLRLESGDIFLVVAFDLAGDGFVDPPAILPDGLRKCRIFNAQFLEQFQLFDFFGVGQTFLSGQFGQAFGISVGLLGDRRRFGPSAGDCISCIFPFLGCFLRGLDACLRIRPDDRHPYLECRRDGVDGIQNLRDAVSDIGKD